MAATQEEMIKLGSAGGMQIGLAEGSIRAMCDRSLDPGDHRNRSRTESRYEGYCRSFLCTKRDSIGLDSTSGGRRYIGKGSDLSPRIYQQLALIR